MKKWVTAGSYGLTQTVLLYIINVVPFLNLGYPFESDLSSYLFILFVMLSIWCLAPGIRDYSITGEFKSLFSYSIKQMILILPISIIVWTFMVIPLTGLVYGDYTLTSISTVLLLDCLPSSLVLLVVAALQIGVLCICYPLLRSYHQKWHTQKFKYPVWSGIWRYIIYFLVSFVIAIVTMLNANTFIQVVIGCTLLAVAMSVGFILTMLFLFLGNDEVTASVTIITLNLALLTFLSVFLTSLLFIISACFGSVASAALFLLRMQSKGKTGGVL